MTQKTYHENPSISLAQSNTQRGCKQIFSQGNTQEILIQNAESGEFKEASIDFTTRKIIDKDQFIKVYISAFPILSDLKNSTKIIYQYILPKVSEKVGSDIYHFSYKDYTKYCENHPAIPRLTDRTYFRALKELMDKEILFKSDIPSLFFLNVAYIFNGDRLRFITEYQLKKKKSSSDSED